MAVARKYGNINAKGSPIARYRLCNSLGAITAATTAAEFPLIKSTTWTDETATTEEVDEGLNVTEVDGQTKRSVEFITMQQDIDSVNLVKSTLKGQYLTIVKEKSQQANADGKYLYQVFPICKPIKNFSGQAPSTDVSMKFSIVNNSSDIGVNLASFATTAFATTLTGTVTIPANEGWITVEI